MNLGYIGTGVMGNPMAKALIEAGHSVTVHDLNRESATNLCEICLLYTSDAADE